MTPPSAVLSRTSSTQAVSLRGTRLEYQGQDLKSWTIGNCTIKNQQEQDVLSGVLGHYKTGSNQRAHSYKLWSKTVVKQYRTSTVGTQRSKARTQRSTSNRSISYNLWISLDWVPCNRGQVQGTWTGGRHTLGQWQYSKLETLDQETHCFTNHQSMMLHFHKMLAEAMEKSTITVVAQLVVPELGHHFASLLKRQSKPSMKSSFTPEESIMFSHSYANTFCPSIHFSRPIIRINHCRIYKHSC